MSRSYDKLCEKYNFNVSVLLLLLCEVTVHFFPWHFILWQRLYVISKCRDENYDDSDSDDGLVI